MGRGWFESVDQMNHVGLNKKLVRENLLVTAKSKDCVSVKGSMATLTTDLAIITFLRFFVSLYLRKNKTATFDEGITYETIVKAIHEYVFCFYIVFTAFSEIQKDNG